MTKGKRIVAQFCGGYVLEDGSVVVERQQETDAQEQATQQTPSRDGNGTDNDGKTADEQTKPPHSR